MSVRYYSELLGNLSRIGAFRRGIQKAVRPGDRVVDLGTGLGTFAFFAARAGAGEVWAVDAHPVVHVAETLGAANGLAEVVRFVRGRVPDVELPRDVDVLIFEDFPVALLDRPTWRLLDDVQRRHLAPGGRMVPRGARYCLAPVESPTLHAGMFPAGGGDDGLFDLDWTPLRDLVANTPRKEQLAPGDLRGRPARGAPLSFVPPPRASQLRVEGRWTAGEEGTVHALALWFELEVAEGVWISNEPRDEPEPWGQWVLPLDLPLPVGEGLTLEAGAAFEELPDGAPGWLRWWARAGNLGRTGHEFAGLMAGPSDLKES